MQFQKFDLYSYTTRLKNPLKNITSRSGIVIQAFCKNSFLYSEVAPLQSFSSESLFQAQKQLISVLKSLINKTVSLKDLRNMGLYPSIFFALASLIVQKNHNQSNLTIPLCKLIYGTFNELLKKIEGTKATTVKIKLNTLSIAQSIELVKIAINKRCHLRLDINKKWTLSEALYFAKHFTKDDFEYIEEPCRNFSETLEFSKQTLFPIAIDESLLTIPAYLLKNIPSLRAIIYKPMILGDWKDLIENIPENVDLIFSSSFESGIGIFAIVQLASFLDQLEKPLGLDTYHMLETDLLNTPFQATSNHLQLISIDVNKEKLCPLISVS